MRHTFSIIFSAISILSYSQVVTVMGKSDNKPIERVVILNDSNNKLVLTAMDGTADISAFEDDEVLTFSHPSFNTLLLRKTEVVETNLIIVLQERPIEIEEVVISASKWEESSQSVPLKIKSIKPSEMVFSNPQTSADMLAATGQVFVQKSQLGGGSPMIRGFAANSLLIVVDGVRMNNAIYRSGNLQNVINVDPTSLASAEVIYGPGSVTYGSDAMGGVMHFITRDPEYNTTPDAIEVDAEGMARYSSASKERSFSMRTGIGGRKLAWVGNFSFSNFDDLLSGDKRPSVDPEFGKREWFVSRIMGQDSIVSNPNFNQQVFSGYKLLNTLQKISFKPNSNFEIKYTFNYSNTTDMPRYDRLTETETDAIPVWAQWNYGPQEWMLNSLSARIFANKGLFDAARLIASTQVYKESRHTRRFDSPELFNRNEKVNVYALNLDFDKYLHPGHRIYYGMEGYYNYVTSSANQMDLGTAAVSPAPTRYPNAGSKYYGLGVYMNYRWEFSEQIYFTGGGRYNFTGLSARNTGLSSGTQEAIDINNNGLSGSIGGVVLPTPDWKVSATISTGFRAPNIDDIGKIFEVASGVVTVPNPNLKPETSANYEIGLQKILNSSFGFEIAGYFSALKNAMVRRDFPINGVDSIIYDGQPAKPVALVNTGEASIYGVHFNVSYRPISTLLFTGAITYNEGQDDIDNVPLRHVAPYFGKVSGAWQSGKWKVEVYSHFQGQIDFADLAPSEQDKPHLYSSQGALGWATLNTRASVFLNNYISFNVAVENILDSYYRTYSSGIGAPGRNFIISVRGFVP